MEVEAHGFSFILCGYPLPPHRQPCTHLRQGVGHNPAHLLTVSRLTPGLWGGPLLVRGGLWPPPALQNTCGLGDRQRRLSHGTARCPA